MYEKLARSSPNNMEYEPGSKARSRKESELLGYGELAISDKPKTHLQHILTAAAINLA